MSSGRIHQINVSNGGVPKHPVPSADVRRTGMEGDAHAKRAIHGGPDRALSLFSLERIEQLAAEGHPIAPGSTGENVTLAGLDWDTLEPGVQLRLGAEVRVEITQYADPCRSVAGSFSDGRYSRISQAKHPGFSRLCGRVLQEGRIAWGDRVDVIGAGAALDSARTSRR